jgi:hypothetical protein
MSKGANGNIYAGYRGIAQIGTGGSFLRFSDANISAKQGIEAPDMVMGDWDRDVYAYGKVTIDGSINGPLNQQMLVDGDVVEWACSRDDDEATHNCGGNASKDIILYYRCGEKRTFKKCYPNSFGISVTAGDVAQFSMDVIGAAETEADIEWDSASASDFSFQTPSKLLTWDQFSISVVKGTTDSVSDSDVPSDIDSATNNIRFQSFSLDVANNAEAAWGIGMNTAENKLFPFDVVAGLRHIGGSLTVFGTEKFEGHDSFDDYCADGVHTMTIAVASTCADAPVSSSIVLKVRFHRLETTLNTGIIQSTVGFTGVTHQTGFPWDPS